MTVYGICYGDGTDTVIMEFPNRLQATRAARLAIAKGLATEVHLVELEGSGPCVADDGTRLSATHAPKHTLETLTARGGDL